MDFFSKIFQVSNPDGKQLINFESDLDPPVDHQITTLGNPFIHSFICFFNENTVITQWFNNMQWIKHVVLLGYVLSWYCSDEQVRQTKVGWLTAVWVQRAMPTAMTTASLLKVISSSCDASQCLLLLLLLLLLLSHRLMTQSGITMLVYARKTSVLHYAYNGSCCTSCQILSRPPRAGSGVVRIDPLRFLAGCCTRRLNQV